MNRAPFLIGVLIILAQAGLLGYGFVRADDPDQIQTPIQPTVQPQMPLDLEGIVPFAREVATSWRTDSQLVGASMQIDWPREPTDKLALELPPGGWIFLAFLSQDDLLTLRIDRASGSIVQTGLISLDKQTPADYAAQLVDLTAASTSSGTALLAAEASYGTDFRNACPDQRFTSWLTVRRLPEADSQAWHIEYKSIADEPQPAMTMNVDWQSGEIQNVTNAAEPCA